MKAKVIIENGETTIQLTPENEFEKDVIEKVNNKKENFGLHTNVSAENYYGTFSKHKIEITITECRP